MRLFPPLAVAIATALALAPAAAHGAAWPSQTLSTGMPAGTPTLSFDARGAALASWAERSGGRRSASRGPSATRFSRQRVAPDTGAEVLEGPPPAPAVDARGGVIALQQRKVRNACGLASVFRLSPRFGSVTGSFAAARVSWTVYSHTEPPAATLAGNARGLAVVSWVALHRDARGRCVRPVSGDVHVVVRRPGRAFGAPMVLARHVSTQSIAAAVGARGDVIVAWRKGTAIAVRTRSPRGVWGRVRSVTAGHVASLAVTAGADGTIYLVWTGRPATGTGTARDVGAAVLPAGSGRARTTTLDRGTWPNDEFSLTSHFAVRLGLLRRGAIAAWTSWDGAHLRAQTAVTGTGGFGAARQATPAGQDWQLGDLAVGPTGRPALALTAGVERRTGPFAAFGSAAGVFGAPEGVGTATGDVSGEALAFDPRTRRPTLTWVQVQPGVRTTATTRAATRTAVP